MMPLGKMTPNDGGPAFARQSEHHNAGSDYGDSASFSGGSSGMSLRDWFAGQALSLQCHEFRKGTQDECAQLAYSIADAMLKEREGSK